MQVVAVPSIIRYNLGTDSPSMSFAHPTLTYCDGRIITPTTTAFISAGQGSNVAGTPFSFNSATKTYTVTLASTNTDYVGSYDIKMTGTYGSFSVTAYARIVVVPGDSLLSDPTNPNQDTSACVDNIYPFLYGGPSPVMIE
jgi:hypothetical protein